MTAGPVLISLSDMPELFGVAQQTCHRWNTAAARPSSRLPQPDLRFGVTPLWFESTIRQWAQTRRKKLVINEAVMDRIRQPQMLG